MQAVQKGKMGITLVSHWFVPFSRSKSNDDASKCAIDFMLGWYISMVLKKSL
jgi:beta-glucosidase